MKRMYSMFLAIIIQSIVIAVWGNQLNQADVMDETWREFRQIHPYGYQTVALKHVGNNCVFVMSEPSESISEEMLSQLFNRYGGNIIVKHQPLGYEGWLADAVGIAQFPDDEEFNSFTKELFTLLYGTDYKAYYTDLDNPTEHVYFSEYRLNYSISAAELTKWFITDKEEFRGPEGVCHTLPALLSLDLRAANELYYSKERGFVAWVVNPDKIRPRNKTFKLNARKFALDTDLIIGAFGIVGGKVAIVARERIVPVTVLPPLRIETLELLATTDNESLGQSFELHNIFAGKNSNNEDMGPIYLSDELWHTEYGNLLNMTDQMLKSWSENNDVHDYNYNYPIPIDWAFNRGVFHDLNVGNTLTYNWNTAGAGYVVQDMNKYDVFAVNRTGSLPVSYIPDGMEGKVDEKINEAEELAYDFFSELNSPDLVREVQYATIYQIFRYYRSTSSLIESHRTPSDNFNTAPFTPNKDNSILKSWSDQEILNSGNKDNTVPSFAIYEGIVEDLLRTISDTKSDKFIKSYSNGLARFAKKYKATNSHTRLKELIETDPYGGFKDYVVLKQGQEYIDSVLYCEPTDDEIKREFDRLLFNSIDSTRFYFERNIKAFGVFPYSEAAKFLVVPRIDNGYNIIRQKYVEEYRLIVHQWNMKVDEYNEKVKNKKATFYDQFLLNQEEGVVKQQLKDIEKDIEVIDDNYGKSILLKPTGVEERYFGALNWLMTDPGEYEAPIGDFYASKFTSHKQWIKSSPTTKSTIHRVGTYGGHNLDAHVTPIKVSVSIPKDYCNVTLVRGQRVVSVLDADKARITPAVLRTIERKAITGNYKLPKAPEIRKKEFVLGDAISKGERGFDLEQHNILPKAKEKVYADGKEISPSSESDLWEAIATEIAETGKSSIKELHFKNYSTRKVHVIADNLRECIVDRIPGESMNLKSFNINEDIQVVSQGDGTVKIVLEQRLETLPQYNPCKAALLDITVPEKVSGTLKKAILKVFKMSEDKINNRFKWKRELRQELQQTHPEIDTNDIKDEFIQLYGHIFNNNFYGFIFELAA